jgi:hypothetical protein
LAVVYHNPPDKAVVFCVDEWSQVRALDRSQPVLPMMPGMPRRRTRECVRHGVTSLVAAFNFADGTVSSERHRRRRAAEFKKFLITLDKDVVWTLTPASTSTSLWSALPGSTADERWFSCLTTQKIRRGVHESVQALEAGFRAWIAGWNQNLRPFTWSETAEEILESLTRYIARISGAAHWR